MTGLSEPVLGHDGAIAAFRRGLAARRFHHAWLLTGPRGVGKATFAHAAARRLLAEAAGPPVANPGLAVPDAHPVARLLDAHSHPDFRLLDRLPKDVRRRELPREDWSDTEELARNISVDQVRRLRSLFGSTPSQSDWRVVVVDSIDDLEPPAANALLKSLEEPPPRCLFLLVSHAPAGLLPTIRSRCLPVRFAPLADDAMAAVVRRVAPDANAGEIAELVATGKGAPGLALQHRGLGLVGIDEDLSRLSDRGDPRNAIRSALAAKFAAKGAQARYALFLQRAPSHIAGRARIRGGPELARALRLWERARLLADTAVTLSLDPAAVTFELAGLVAALAPAKDASSRHG